jgi:molybdopterin/thiamine biosynthesis adenylyltransferase
MAGSSVPDIFSRNLGSITADQQKTLQQATVAVIGCGGLGGFVIEELARLGIGILLISDPDIFDASNINRQLYATKSTLGQNKALIAADRIHTLHDQTTVLRVTESFQEKTEQLFTDTQVIVDCLDNTKSRLELAAYCKQYRCPLVHGAVQQWYGQVGVQLKDGTLVQGLYSSQKQESPAPSVLSCTVAVIASIQVAEICKLLLGMKSDLHNAWMSIDLCRMTFDLIES